MRLLVVLRVSGPLILLVMAGEESKSDEEFEKRLATLKKAKGEVPYGQSRREKAAPSGTAAEGAPVLK